MTNDWKGRDEVLSTSSPMVTERTGVGRALNEFRGHVAKAGTTDLRGRSVHVAERGRWPTKVPVELGRPRMQPHSTWARGRNDQRLRGKEHGTRTGKMAWVTEHCYSDQVGAPPLIVGRTRVETVGDFLGLCTSGVKAWKLAATHGDNASESRGIETASETANGGRISDNDTNERNQSFRSQH